MCAVIGALLVKPSKEDLDLLRRVFLESSIRGLHATGLSVIKSEIHTYIDPKPAVAFDALNDLSSLVNRDGNLYLIGHCRYSTSDLEYNQPFFNDDVSIVHNGVITQELPENWHRMYGYKTLTKNDSELLLKTIEEGKEPLVEWLNSSIAAVELHRKTKSISYYRNGKRPLYHAKLSNGVIVTSTRNIMERATSSEIVSEEVEKDCRIRYDGTSFNYERYNTGTMELQHV
jgi:asparagine synthetase B (glutamine-hydrolysing)